VAAADGDRPGPARWGLFNLVEGLVDHQLLGLHHVRPGPHQTAYDLAFLATSGLLLAGGLLLYRRSFAARSASVDTGASQTKPLHT